MGTVATRKIVLYTHLGLGDMIIMNGAVRYFATKYEEVLIICKRRYQEPVSAMYDDNHRIKMCIIEDDNDLYPWSSTKKFFKDKGYDVMGCGCFSDHTNPTVYDIPHCFYDDLNIPRDYRTSYFSIPHCKESVAIANSFTVPYILVHEESSIAKLPIRQTLEEQGETRLILDVNKNVYPKDSPYWTLAQQVVNIPLINLVCVIEKAEELHMIESSVYALALHLDLSAVKKKVVYTPDVDDLFTTTNTLHVFTCGPRLKPYEFRSKV